MNPSANPSDVSAIVPRARILSSWLAANPLVCPAIGLAAGILVDSWYAVPVWIAGPAFIAAGVLMHRSRRRYALAPLGLLVVALAAGALRHDLAMRRWPADHVVRCCSTGPVDVRLVGTVVSTPVTGSASMGSMPSYVGSPRTQFVLAAEQAEAAAGNVPVNGLVSVFVRQAARAIMIGDRVELFGELRRTQPPDNPGGIDWRLVHQRNGLLVQLFCRRAAEVVVVQPGSSPWRHRLGRLRSWACTAMLDDTFTGNVPGSGFLAAMVLGQRSAVSPALNEAFVRSGTVHYLSVSGAHVGMLVGAIWGVGLLAGLSRRQCAAWAIAAATAYAVLAEPSPPIVRAAIMTDLGCLALLVRRPLKTANWLALSALVLLVAQPTQLFNAGFQLSYLTLLSVIYLSSRLHQACTITFRRITRRDDPLLSPEIQKRIGMGPRYPRLDSALRTLGWYLAVGVSAWLVGGLLAVYHFHQLQAWGWLNSIVLMPFVWLVMVLGLLKTVLAGLAPALAGILAWPLAGLTRFLIGLVEVMARVPGSGLPAPGLPAAVVWLGLGVALAWVVQPRLRLNVHAIRLSALGFLLALLWTAAPRRPGHELRVHVLSVGNGTAALIELPNGKTLLYDAGCFPPYDLERWTIGPLLSRERCPRIDAAILSHAKIDHYGGMFDLIGRRTVRAVVTTPYFESTAAESSSVGRRLVSRLGTVSRNWHRATRDGRLSGTGDVSVEVLWPPPGGVPPDDEGDGAIVVRLGYNGKRILLCGDIGDYAMDQLRRTTDLRADVLLLPRHGNVTSGTAAFVRAVDPRCCIRSTGQRQTGEGLALATAGRQYFSTADNGAVQVAIIAGTLSVKPHLNASRK